MPTQPVKTQFIATAFRRQTTARLPLQKSPNWPKSGRVKKLFTNWTPQPTNKREGEREYLENLKKNASFRVGQGPPIILLQRNRWSVKKMQEDLQWRAAVKRKKKPRGPGKTNRREKSREVRKKNRTARGVGPGFGRVWHHSVLFLSNILYKPKTKKKKKKPTPQAGGEIQRNTACMTKGSRVKRRRKDTL